MTHLEVENLASDYLEGRLETAARTQVDDHLAHCSACRGLVADLRHVVELCRSAEELEPAPRLMAKILEATVGQRKPTLQERFAALLRPVVQPRFAYAAAMAVFSLSLLVSGTKVNLRSLTLEDLNPRVWAYRANREGHLLYARAEKFYYDLRVVYEIESRFRRLRSEPQQEQKQTPKPESEPGGAADRNQLGNAQLASLRNLGTAGARRSPSR